MLSLDIRCALERDVVGQSRPVQTIVRALTVSLAGLAQPGSPLGIYLFVGPTGTGKTHLARSVAKLLHGDPRLLAVVDCIQIGGPDDWGALTRQIAPHFREPVPGQGDAVVSMGPLSVLLVEHLECARPDLVQALFTALESGYLMLPDGRCGNLAGCLTLVTSSLCAREIYDAARPEIGFSPAREIEETERARIYQSVCVAADKLWGPDFLGHLDDLLVFHPLTEADLPFILRRLILQINERLAVRGISCELEPEAARFLLSRGAAFLRNGAWTLARVVRRFVLFPVADLVHAGDLPPGSRIRVAADGDQRLRFDVRSGTPQAVVARADRDPRIEVPVEWDSLSDGVVPGLPGA